MKRFFLGIRLAFLRIALDQAEREQSRANRKCALLSKSEMNARIEYLDHIGHTRHIISHPSDGMTG